MLQLFRATQQIIFRYEIEEGEKILDTEMNGRHIEMYNDTVLGFNSQGDEIVRLSVAEPFHVRPAQYQNSI